MEKIDFGALYNETDNKILKIAEDSLNTHYDRVNEIISFAKESKIKIIGIANCTAFMKEAAQQEEILKEQVFMLKKFTASMERSLLMN